ncbi:hypothetical protein BEP19_08475 [Ammoniphilus oxalaticus]|uniref:YtkA-like domain-containing protein n=1 Tax=Ammoniphilus oxalaticus TaxID=66863 RepID=A0A419SK56_9BACL|nr:FixH family protein [Ammoniphilus oxalaticus]RKD24414.1 hypothetical protein BEP19_08475 [Ammoniphilus oxalaticus]
MKKMMIVLVGMMLLVAGCGSAKIGFEVVNTPEYKNGVESEIILKATESGKAAEGLVIEATLEMAKMDHGHIEATFEEVEAGEYRAAVELPMGGEWIADIRAEADGSETTEVITFDVKE